MTQLWLHGLHRKAVLWNRRRLHRRAQARRWPYAAWCQRFDMLDDAALAALALRRERLPSAPRVAWLFDGSTPAAAARRLLASLQAQLYPHWCLCVAAPPEPDAMLFDWHAAAAAEPRIGVVATAGGAPWQQQLLAASTEDWIGFVDGDDELRPHATLLLVEAALRFPGSRMVFGDEDHRDAAGARCDPHFKCRLHTELLLSHDCIGGPLLIDREHLRQARPFDGELPTPWRHHVALACTEQLPQAAVVHVPHVLLHRHGRRPTASALAVQLHLQRTGSAGAAAAVPGFDGVRVQFALPAPPPGVTVLIPTRNGTLLLERCLQTLLQRSTYPAFNVVIIDNGSDDPRALMLMERVARRDPRVSVRRDARPFNFAALNNGAVDAGTSEFIALVNDDIEFITPGWLEEMVALAARPGVGAVGARLWYGDGTLQHGGVIAGIGGAAGHAHKRLPRGDPGPAGRGWRLQNFSAVTAACMVLRRAHWLAVGGMDADRFAVAFNDVDFCLRLQAAGLRNVWTPHAEMIHHESVSRGRDRDGAKRARMLREEAALRSLHAAVLKDDPAYNPNLTLRREDCALADPPRVNLREPWFDASS